MNKQLLSERFSLGGYIALLVFLDQISKYLASHKLILGYPIEIFSGYFDIVLVHNYGAAYGIFQNQRLFLSIFGVFFIVFSLVFYSKLVNTVWSKRGLLWILAGAVGNVFDRLRLGYVVDFIDIKIFPVFNFADVFIDIGLACFILDLWMSFRERREHGDKKV